jgi:hypothetical protein
LQLRRLEDAPTFTVDDLTAGLTLKSQSEFLGNAVSFSTDPPCRDNAGTADFHPAAGERPVAILAASEGVQMPLNERIEHVALSVPESALGSHGGSPCRSG